MSESIDIGHGISIPLAEIEIRASRSGGPGGQHANKTAS
ncbi:MAG: aminoacyl-tRNA hydrolase, partial [Solirubrobacterales bacterium]|nr:aminoacyl-tRNA hydrolase [Solirubrobacterales bacterium]